MTVAMLVCAWTLVWLVPALAADWATPFTIYLFALMVICALNDKRSADREQMYIQMRGIYEEEYARLTAQKMAYSEHISPGVTPMELGAAERKYFVQTKALKAYSEKWFEVETAKHCPPTFWSWVKGGTR